jgi:hypothetical protein
MFMRQYVNNGNNGILIVNGFLGASPYRSLFILAAVLLSQYGRVNMTMARNASNVAGHGSGETRKMFYRSNAYPMDHGESRR